MWSRERVQSIRAATRRNILDAAFKIIKEDGWHELSMRKVADGINYTVPIIYEHFAGKNDLLLALAKQGFDQLTYKIDQARSIYDAPEAQLKQMWLAFWDFSIDQKELYQLMFGVEVVTCDPQQIFCETNGCYNLFKNKIAEIIDTSNSSLEVNLKFYLFLSLVHGLIAINMVAKSSTPELNSQILHHALETIINDLKKI